MNSRIDNSRHIRARQGSEIKAKHWSTEAAVRMLMRAGEGASGCRRLPDLRFIAFDVQIDEKWLSVPDAESGWPPPAIKPITEEEVPGEGSWRAIVDDPHARTLPVPPSTLGNCS